MFYLSKTSVPVPADAPYAAHLNEQKEWAYHQKRHQEALHNIRGQLDSSQPKSINPAAQSIQAHSRRFHVDAKNAEIGRENRKLVDKLTHIAKSSGQCAPPGQLSGYGSGPQPGSLGGGCTMRLPPKPPVAPGGPPGGAGASQRSRSLNDNQRRKVQQQTNQDNAGMVRRILSVKSSFSAEIDEKNFQRHKRAGILLQRMPEGGRKPPRSLPPLNRRPNSYPMPARGLEAFLTPSDLVRSQSGPGAVGRQALLDGGVGPRADSAHATTAPAGSLPEPDTFERPPRGAATEGGPGALGSQTYSFGGFDTYDSLSGEAQSQSNSAVRADNSAVASAPAEPGSRGVSAREGTPVSASGVSQNAMPRPAVGPGPEEEAGSAARGASAFGKRDSETERRQWTQDDDNKEPGVGISAAPAVGIGIGAQGAASKEDSKVSRNNSRMGMTGLSNVSDLQYADDWDEDSFSQSAAPSRGPSTSAMATTGQPLREPSGLQPVLEPTEDVAPVSKLGPLAAASLAGGATASPATDSASPLAPLASASLAGNIPVQATASPATNSVSAGNPLAAMGPLANASLAGNIPTTGTSAGNPLAALGPLANASLAGNMPTTGSAVAASSSAGAVDEDFSKPPDFGAKKPGRRPR